MFKELLEKMGLSTNGKVIVGEEARKKIELDEVRATSNLADQEINFILAKLRQAQYTGAEFEMFHSIWIKLSNLKVNK